MLELRNITKSFGQQVAVDQINLTFQPGQIHTLLGENGASKATLMNLIYGFSQPSAGKVAIDGRASGPNHPTRQ
tara:strand:- start:114 stop:335 length:222 start_codon:yes stop_codon:yes gene_type:complete